MNRTRRLLAITAIGAFLLTGAACGSSGSDASSDDPAATTAADGGSDTGTDEGTDEGDTGAGEADCAATAESNNLSGDSVVLFAADQDELRESDLADEDIAVIAADASSMEPGEIEVDAGAMFGIKLEGGGSIDAVIIGCAGGQTLVPNVGVGFVITEPGTYPVSLDIAGTDLGTVVVS